jgi:hypothetical protein
MNKVKDVVEDVSDAIRHFLIPGTKQFEEQIIDSEFNQRHKLVGYNPFKYLFTPFDFTPLGAAVKVQKGYKAIRGGNKLIRLGISGFGKRLKQKGYVDVGGTVASKGYQYLTGRTPPSKGKVQFGVVKPIHSEKSRVDSSLTSESKTRGTKNSYAPSVKKVKAYYVTSGENPCRKGYRFDEARGLCVKKK